MYDIAQHFSEESRQRVAALKFVPTLGGRNLYPRYTKELIQDYCPLGLLLLYDYHSPFNNPSADTVADVLLKNGVTEERATLRTNALQFIFDWDHHWIPSLPTALGV